MIEQFEADQKRIHLRMFGRFDRHAHNGDGHLCHFAKRRTVQRAAQRCRFDDVFLQAADADHIAGRNAFQSLQFAAHEHVEIADCGASHVLSVFQVLKT